MEQIGKYRVLSELKRGGLGRLYQASDPSIPRQVAIKVLNSLEDPQLILRFRKEAATLAQLHHKNIVTIHDFGIDNGIPFLVMELLEGQDLSQLVASHSLPPLWQVMEIMQQAAQGLQHAHEHGIVHGDVTPSNIWLMPDGTVKIIDFGIAWAVGTQRQLAGLEGHAGTLLYLPPEYFSGTSGGALDTRADIFAYGVIYYLLISGQHPFEAEDAAAVICNVSMKEPALLPSLAPECPPALDRIIRRALAKEPDLRYQKLQDLEFDVAPILSDSKRKCAEALLQKALKFLQADQSELARVALRQVLELDPNNHEARQLHESLQQRFTKAAIDAKVGSIVRQAAERLSERQYGKAVELLKQGVRLDPENAMVQARLEEARTASALHQRVATLLREAKCELDLQNLALALQYAEEAAKLDDRDPETTKLLEAVHQEVERNSQKRLAERLAAIQHLLDLLSFERALAELFELQKEHPGDPRVTEAIAHAQHCKQAHQQNERRRRDGLAVGKRLLAGQQFAEAVKHFESLQSLFPEDDEIRSLVSYAEEERQSRGRAGVIEQASSQARNYAAFGRFDQAVTVLKSALDAYPGDSVLTRLLRATLNSMAAYEEYQNKCRVDSVAQEIERCAAQGRWQELLRVSTVLTREEVGRLPRLNELVSQAREQLRSCVNGESPFQLQRRNCGHCGNALSSEMKFCDACGRPVNA